MIRNVTQYLNQNAQNYPDRLSVSDENSFYTFATLQKTAMSIGTALAKFNVQKKSVAVLLPKSPHCIAAFMGVAYSGGFYTPLDTNMPFERVKKILATLQNDYLITNEESVDFARNILQFKGEIFVFESIINTTADEKILNEINSTMCDTDLLYVMFTSGSTGTPKGVCVSHGAVINFAGAIVPLFGITHNDILGNQAAFYFDLSVMDISCMLKAAAHIFIINGDLFSQPVALLECIKKHNITAIAWVPSALVMVSKLRAFKNVDVSSTLNKVLFIGEVMPTKQYNKWKAALPNALFSNFYGPTEATVACTAEILTREYKDDEPLPVGTPLYNYDVFLLDENNKLIDKTDTETQGEICIRGVSVARGYYNNPEMTNAAFVQNPLATFAPETIYRTGDWAKYNTQQSLLYIGRRDFQIKHLGHRIELGEIEAAAIANKEIETAACVYDKKRNKIIMFCETALDKDAVLQKMQNKLPQYMWPSKIIILSEMPLNSSGKIDRKALENVKLV